MKAGFYLQGVFLYFVYIFACGISFAQYSSESDSSYLLEDTEIDTVIPPFYQGLEEKSYYHARQIHGMKQDMNAHSRNLRDLRTRFNQVFYGRKTSGGGEDPFLVGAPPQMPVKAEVKPRIVYVPPPPRRPRDRYEPPQTNANLADENQAASNEETNPAHLLAFSVQEPGSYHSHDGRQVNPETSARSNGLFSKPRRFDYYIMPRISVAIPSRIERNIYHPSTPHYKRYKAGFSGTLSAGIRLDRWRLGIAGIHQQHELHPTSWAKESPSGPRFDRTGKSRSSALMIEGSHVMPVYSSLFMNFDLGLGYRWSKSSYEYSNPLSPTKNTSIDDDFLLWSLGIGGGWSFNEQASLLLAYRYFAEETVPTHNIDLGLEFDF